MPSAAHPVLAALERLYEAHHSVLLRVAHAICADRAAAEQLVRDVLLDVWRCGVPHDGAERTALLRAIARKGQPRLDGETALRIARLAALTVPDIAHVLACDERQVKRLLVHALRSHAPASEARGDRRVLVVDDDETCLETYAEILVNEGYVVETAVDGASALLRLQTWAPHLLVTDIAMPGLDGWQLVDRCRQDGQLAALPVIVVSGALAEDDDDARARSLGVPTVLRKPIQAATLVVAAGELVTA